MNSIELTAPSKINLTLSVRDRRADGFHEIESLVVPVGLYDRLTISAGQAFSLRIEGHASCPEDESNLVDRAAHALARAAGCAAEAHIILRKVIPIGAGLGGGSSDAAAALNGLQQLWGLNWPVVRLMPVAALLGSDVPFFLEGRPALLRGRGELLESFPMDAELWSALILPPYSLSTAEVYRRFDELSGSCGRASQSPLIKGAARELMEQSFNDLEPAAFSCEPRLGELHDLLNNASDRKIRMSGSGSALFTLFDDEQEARKWSTRVGEASAGRISLHVVPVLTKSHAKMD